MLRTLPSTETEGRWLVKFDEYVILDEPGVWKGWRNPVRYTTWVELGISLQGRNFQPMPERPKSAADTEFSTSKTLTKLTIAEAKRLLAETFGVKPEAVEITVRG